MQVTKGYYGKAITGLLAFYLYVDNVLTFVIKILFVELGMRSASYLASYSFRISQTSLNHSLHHNSMRYQ